MLLGVGAEAEQELELGLYLPLGRTQTTIGGHILGVITEVKRKIKINYD